MARLYLSLVAALLVERARRRQIPRRTGAAWLSGPRISCDAMRSTTVGRARTVSFIRLNTTQCSI